MQLFEHGWISNRALWICVIDAQEKEKRSLYMTSALKAIIAGLGSPDFPSFMEISYYGRQTIDTRTGAQIRDDLVKKLQS